MSQTDLKPYEELLTAPTIDSYKKVLAMLVEATGAQRGCFWLENHNNFIYQGDEELRKQFPFSRQAVDTVLAKGRSLLSYDTTTDARFTPFGSVMMHNVRSCLCAACTDNYGEVLVLGYFDNTIGAEQFTDEHLDLLRRVLSLVPDAVPVED